MARKKIREYDSKRLLKAHLKRLKGTELPLNVAQVRPHRCWLCRVSAVPHAALRRSAGRRCAPTPAL